MTKSEIWEVTATLTIPTEPDHMIRSVVGAVSYKLQVDLENLRSMGDVELEFSISSRKTGEITQ